MMLTDANPKDDAKMMLKPDAKEMLKQMLNPTKLLKRC